MKPALLVIDVQKFYFDISEETRKSMERAVGAINAVVSLFRGKGLPVVWIQHQDDEIGVVPGTVGFDMPDSFDVRPGDLRVTKTVGNALYGNTLEEDLRGLGVDVLVLTGFCAEYCVLSTSRGARDRGFSPMVLRGALASVEPDNILFVERVEDMLSVGVLIKLLEGVAPSVPEGRSPEGEAGGR